MFGSLRPFLLMISLAAAPMWPPMAQSADAPMAESPAQASDEMTQDEREDAGGTCAEWVRRVKLLERFRDKQASPEPSIADVPYGPHPLQTFDVYRPAAAESGGASPIIVMVHGGGWCVGDKGAPGVTNLKVERWVGRGFVFISVNYPMVSDGSNALAQARDVALALAHVQANARQWGGDPDRLILMGHSAGEHLVPLVNADSALREAAGARRPLGTISLDAGAIDVPMQMPRVYRFLETRYREAFGETREEWVAASPYHRLDRQASPWLGVCSTRRRDEPCEQAKRYAEKSLELGVAAEVLPQSRSHAKINEQLGEPGAYTRAVERFMGSLDPVVAQRLKGR